jgi:hypothetical protein
LSLLFEVLASACAGPRPFLLQGNPDSAQIGYSGAVDATTDVARQHCAQYERIPRFVEAEQNIAFFDCVRP